MFDLDRVTQENAAMADDSLQLSEKLQLEADELWQVVAQFHLPGDTKDLSRSALTAPSHAA